MSRKAALTQGIPRLVEYGDIFGLWDGQSRGRDVGLKNGSLGGLSGGVPIEILVSPEMIVEVYGASEGREMHYDIIPDRGIGGEWTESRAAGDEAVRVFANYRKEKRARFAAAYAAIVILAGLAMVAMWFAL